MANNDTKKSGRGANGQDLILSDKSPWAIQEAYKALRTNVLFSLPGNDSKVIGVTSAFMHDGKSTNAINHAISFGQIGKKVMLMECDLRRPTIAAKLGIKGKPGLSDALVGQARVSECLRRVSDFKIDVFTAGNLPPDPTWLLQSSQMNALIGELRNQYDYIVVDLPPVTTVADASIMSRYIDGYLFVVRHNLTDSRAIASALKQLRLANARIIGFVYNDARREGSGYYGSARYSYKYTNSSKD
ncbi:MAG: CpsD/CapB family tyrosine-protein kinase [Bilifractor sp.]|jgi:capsular exopolysaccharide synthesis family protein